MAALLGRHLCFFVAIALRNPGRERRLTDLGKVFKNETESTSPESPVVAL
jgi:hypothetical protein